MEKRAFDIVASAAGLVVLSPVILVFLFLIWLQDRKSPLYFGPRVGLGGRSFFMVKMRSMMVHADRTGVESTGAADARITAVGHIVRRLKLDELTQLWNVLMGEMSLVGPRPNTRHCVDQYTAYESRILQVRPGITDLASIVFSDEGSILENEADPDHAYDVLIRPWKSRLALFYKDHASFLLDLQIIGLTMTALVSKPAALRGVSRVLERFKADSDLRQVSARVKPLKPSTPPGALP